MQYDAMIVCGLMMLMLSIMMMMGLNFNVGGLHTREFSAKRNVIFYMECFCRINLMKMSKLKNAINRSNKYFIFIVCTKTTNANIMKWGLE